RQATRAAAHLPKNWEEVCECAFFRLVHVVKEFDIPSLLIVNMDQTGVLYIPGYKYTYEKKGSKQVNVIAKDEKQGYTLCVSSTADGKLLPFQQVYSGKTDQSLPEKNSTNMEEALGAGIQFTVAASVNRRDSHFSTQKTMKEFMKNIYKPHYKRVLEANPYLLRDQRAVLYLDCYPVHTSADFLDFLQSEYLYVIPLFVPANCKCANT
ncbi:uncharacterized protein FOMMEDRAFT_66428, partial [Fomitiporia mediterranea MF3/22]|uniref:uncharacterized protein n=1 Tax=Fomitiporia mediterranea (strain MF3/22) TaxID=694068 RepID=UPI0004407F36